MYTNSYTTILCLFAPPIYCFWASIYPDLLIEGRYNMDTLSSQMVQYESVTSTASVHRFFKKNPANSLYEGKRKKTVKIVKMPQL